MARKKSSFYHVRNKAGLNEQRAADILGVTLEDIKQYDNTGAPLMAERLLQLWDSKHVGVEGWNGFLFSRGVLRYKNRRWTPETILLWRDQAEEIERLTNDLRRLSTWKGLSTIIVEKAIDNIPRSSRVKRHKSI